ncbi:MAG: sporulation transcriptional regulator SpoIIID [Candidatus Gallimonas sp.]
MHKDVTERLKYLDSDLYRRVQAVLERNLRERHIRGGSATKKKYERLHRLRGKSRKPSNRREF